MHDNFVTQTVASSGKEKISMRWQMLCPQSTRKPVFDRWTYNWKEKVEDGDKDEEFPKMKFKIVKRAIVVLP